jgi:hypothetical protein
MKTVLTTDWAPHAEALARRLAQVCAVVYVAGYVTGAWLHRLNDSITALLVRMPQPAPAPAPVPVQRPIVQRLAPAAPPAAIAPPRDPMARAVAKVLSGMSQRQAAALCGVSRSSLQRALRG